jgi:hypothetical protein
MTESLSWQITEYADHDRDTLVIVGSKYQVERGGEVICTGISDQKLAEDIAAIPLMKQMLQNGIGSRLVPAQRSEHSLQVAQLQLLEEILAELKRGNAAERTGSISSVQIEDAAKGPPRIASKHYVGSPLTTADVDEALRVHGHAHVEAERLQMANWTERGAADAS